MDVGKKETRTTGAMTLSSEHLEVIPSRHNGRWTILRILIAVILLVAAGMKMHQLATMPSFGEGILHATWFNFLVVEFEIFFGLWLISGMMPTLTWLTSFGCFSIFAAVSFYKFLAEEVSCGCFGVVTISPWITCVFDLGIIGLLVYTRPTGIQACKPSIVDEFSHLMRKRSQVAVLCLLWLLVALPITYAAITGRHAVSMELGEEFGGFHTKKTIILEPEQWLGKECPLLEYLVSSHNKTNLKNGTWNLVLVHTDCPKCQQILSGFERRKTQEIAVVVIPSRPTETSPITSFPTFILNDQKNWHVKTPCMIKLSDGICKVFVDSMTEQR